MGAKHPMKKRLLSAVMAAAMLFTFTPVQAFSQPTEEQPSVDETVVEQVQPQQDTPEQTQPDEQVNTIETEPVFVSNDTQPENQVTLFANGIYEGSYKDQLSQLEQQFYDYIVANPVITMDESRNNPISISVTCQGPVIMKDGKKTIDYNASPEYSALMDSLGRAGYAVCYDYPMYSWILNGGFKYSTSLTYSSLPDVGQMATFTVNKAMYSFVKPPYYDDIATATAKVDEIAATVDKSAPLYDQVKQLHDAVCNLTNYNNAAVSVEPSNHPEWLYAWSPYGTFTGKDVVCEGYARAFKMLCDKVGIPCALISGLGNGGAHMWNAVKMDDGKWYGLDATWDDQSSIIYNYFLKPASGFSDHTAQPKKGLVYPTLSSTEYTPPAATMTVICDANGWTKNLVTITVHVNSYTSDLTCSYVVDNAAAQPVDLDETGKGIIILSNEMNGTVTLTLKKGADTIDTTQVRVQIDKTAPSISNVTLKETAQPLSDRMVTNKQVQVSATITDTGSGVKTVTASVGGDSYPMEQSGNTFTATIDKEYKDQTITISAQDKVGNTSSQKAGENVTTDKTPPVFSKFAVKANSIQSTAATVEVTLDSDGTVYYLTQKSGQAAPSADTIVTSGTSIAAGQTASEIALTGLTAKTGYTVYAVAKDLAGNTSSVQKVSFETKADTLKVSGTLTAAGTYGVQWNNLAINASAATVTNEKGETVEGSWSWQNTSATQPQVTTKTAVAVFTPKANPEQYNTLTANATITIQPKQVNNAAVELSATQVVFDGTAKQPTVVAVRDGNTVIPATEYTVSYKNNINAGTATVEITDKTGGNYVVNGTAQFTIAPASLTNAAVSVTGQYIYNGKTQSVDGKVTVTLGSNTLKEGVDYTVEQPTNAINAGTATVNVVGKGNYTGTKQGSFTIQPATLTITGATLEPKVYDGTTTAQVKQVVFGGLVNGESLTNTQYTAVAAFDSADAGNNKTATVTVQLANTVKNYRLDNNILKLSGQTIQKAVVSTEMTKAEGYVVPDAKGEVILPTLPAGAAFGKPSTKDTVINNLSVKDNTLTFDGSKDVVVGNTYTVTIPVTGATNYEDYTVTVTLTGTNKLVPTGEPTLSTSTLTYGDALSKITLSGTMTAEGKTVAGTFAWDTPTETPVAGSYNAAWTFTPNNTNLYEVVTGVAKIQVNKKALTASVASVEDKTFDGTTTAAGTLTLTGAVKGENPTAVGTFAWTSAAAGTSTVNVTNIQLSGEWGKNYTVQSSLTNQDAGKAIQPKALQAGFFQPIADQTYTGKEQAPALTVTDKTLTQEDYTVAYKDNTNAGTATITVTGKNNYTGTVTLTFNILPASFQYQVANQTMRIGNQLADVSAQKDATGVNGEWVQGTLTWYADQEHTKALEGSWLFEGKEGDTITLYWVFTPKAGQTNYRTEALEGSTVFTLAEKDVPVLAANSFAKTYDGKAVTVEQLTKDATATFDGKAVAGTWSMKSDSTMKNVGSYNVTLTFQPEDTKNYVSTSIAVQVSIEKQALTILPQLSTNHITTSEELPTVALVYEGLVAGETLTPKTAPSFSGMPAKGQAGEFTILWNNLDTLKAEIEKMEAAQNYAISYQSTAKLTVTNAQLQPGGNNGRIEIAQGIASVPESLKNTAFNTVEAIRKELARVAIEKLPGVAQENTLLLDVNFLVTTDGGKTWQNAGPENFPAGGLTITLPYPAGTNAADFDFVVTHMFTAQINGRNPGDVEVLAVTETENGLQVIVTSLSPIAIGWKKTATTTQPTPVPPTATTPPASSNQGATSAASPSTGDTGGMVWVGLLAISAAAAFGIYFYKTKYRKDK